MVRKNFVGVAMTAEYKHIMKDGTVLRRPVPTCHRGAPIEETFIAITEPIQLHLAEEEFDKPIAYEKIIFDRYLGPHDEIVYLQRGMDE